MAGTFLYLLSNEINFRRQRPDISGEACQPGCRFMGRACGFISKARKSQT